MDGGMECTGRIGNGHVLTHVGRIEAPPLPES